MRTLLLTAVLVSLTLAGCSSTTTTTTTTTGSGMGMVMTKTIEVSMKGNKFVNETVTAHLGDIIHWTNNDMVGHTVTATSGATFDSNANCVAPVPAGAVCTAPGGTYKYTTDKVGEIAYHCKVHANMTGKIVVLAAMMMNMTH